VPIIPFTRGILMDAELFCDPDQQVLELGEDPRQFGSLRRQALSLVGTMVGRIGSRMHA